MSPSCPATGLCLACDAAPSSRAQWRAARRAERTHRWPGGRGPPPPHSRHLLTTAASHGSWSRRSRASRRCSRCGCSGSEFRVHIRRKNKKKNPPLCHPRSRFLSLPLCGACPIVGYCGFLNKLLTPKIHGKPTKRVLQRHERGEHGLRPIRHDTSIHTRSYTVLLYPHHVSGSFLAERASRLARDEGPPGSLRFAGVNSGASRRKLQPGRVAMYEIRLVPCSQVQPSTT